MTLQCVADFVTATLVPRHSAHRSQNLMIKRLRNALVRLDADDRELWVKMGMALKGLGEEGRSAWIDWSKTSRKYDEQDAHRVWDSFNPETISHDAVFAEASRAGWRGADAGPYAIEIRWADKVELPKSGDYLIKGIIGLRQVSIWFGPPGNGKTFLMLYLAHCIAQGRPAFGRRVRQARTLYMALEGRGGIDKRVYSLVKHFGKAPLFGVSDTPLELIHSEKGATQINRQHLEGLIEAIRFNDVKLVMIDTLNLTLGGADENDNSVMGPLLKSAGEIAEACNCHVAFVAHSPKTGIESGPRGGGAQRGNADLVVSISGEDIFTASSHAPGGKSKDGEPFKLHFRLEGHDLSKDDEGEMITSCTVEEIDKPPVQAKKLSAKNQEWLNDLISMFREVGEIAPVLRTPQLGFSVLTLTRDQVRNGYRQRGRLGDVSLDGNIKSRHRTAMCNALNALKDAGKIGMTEKYIWLIE